MNDELRWFTMDDLRNLSTAVVVVRFIAEYTKGTVDALAAKIGARVPTAFWAYIVAWYVMAIPQAVAGELTWTTVYLDTINAAVASILAGFMKRPEPKGTIRA